MFKNKRVLIRNLISGFVPVILVLTIAVSFLNRSFQMLEERNRSVIKVQIESILHDMEMEIAMSRQVADQICRDSILSRNNMLEYGPSAVAGVKRLSMYGLRSNPQVFLTYIPEQLVTKNGTCSRQVYVQSSLALTEASTADWERAFKSKENLTSVLLESQNGYRHLLMLYHYPQSSFVEEKWIGFLFSERELARMMENTAKSLGALAILSYQEQALTFVDYSNTPQDDKATFLEAIRSGQAEGDYAIIECDSNSYQINLVMAFDNSLVGGELADEVVKMIAVGLITVLLVSCFIWYYGKFRYRFLYEIRQLAVSGRPELEADAEADEYEIIRAALKQSFEELKSKDEELELVGKIAKRQMSWILLCAPTAEGLDISQIMEVYGIEDKGGYYGAMVFRLREEIGDDPIYLDDIPDVLFSATFTENTNHYLVLALSMTSKDANRSRRQEIAQTVLQRLVKEEIDCMAISCGLVYEEMSQIGVSKQEACSVLQICAVSERARKTVMFFDKLAHLPNNISQTVDDELDRFVEVLRCGEGAEALDILKQLLSDAIDEAQLSYIKYKLVHNTIDVMRELEISSEQMDELVQFVNLDAQSFENQVSAQLSKLFIKLKKKDVTDAQILLYIEQNYSNSEISMRVIADHFGISERSVSRVLKKSTNKTYKEYLNQIRLEQACRLLLETNLDVRTIIKQVGYYDVSSFNRLFRQAFNMTPVEFRNKHMEE